jgi:transcriptional regulator with XRE-family HTH domain
MEYESLRLFGQHLKELRGKRSARSVAKESGISAVYLLALESGINKKTGKPSRPSFEVVSRLASTLHVEKSELMGLAGYDYLLAEKEGQNLTTHPDVEIWKTPLVATIRRLDLTIKNRWRESGTKIASGEVNPNVLSEFEETVKRNSFLERVKGALEDFITRYEQEYISTVHLEERESHKF